MFTDVFMQFIQNKGITPYRIAKETGISQGLMNEYKNGKKLPTLQNLIKIADYLNCSVDYLLGRSDNPTELYSEKNGAITNDHGNIVTGNGNFVSNRNDSSVEQQDEMTKELVKAFCELCFSDKMKIMNTIMKMAEE